MHTEDETPITAVKLYRSGATVTRTLTLRAPLPEQVQITGLPLALTEDSVRLRASASTGEGEVVVSGVHVGLYIRPRDAAPPSPEAAALRETRADIRRLTEQITQLDEEIAALSSIEAPPRPRGEAGQPPPASPMAARVALERFTDAAISTRLTERAAARAALAVKREEQADQQDQLRRSTHAHTVRPDEVTYAATAALHVTGGPEAVTLQLDYFVPGARWAPVYQLLIDRPTATATLQMRAAVAQRTGEDWSDVAMTFSTADPLDDRRMPALSAIRIGKAQPPPSSLGYRPPPPGTDSLFTDYLRDLQRAQRALPPAPRLPELAVTPRSLVLASLTESLVAFDDAEEGDDYLSASAPMFAASAAPGGGGMPAPAPPPRTRAAMKAKRRRSPSRDKGAPTAEAVMDELELEEEPSPAERGAAQPFSALRLAPPGDARRGSLIPITAAERVRQALAAAGAEAPFDVLAQIRAAEEQARSAPRRARAVSRGRFDYAYPAHSTLDVPGDGGVHTVPVLEWSAPCEMSYVVAPRVEPVVYRQVELVNPADAPLLPGPVEVYLDGQYAVTAELPMVAEQGPLSLGLGVEQAIRCARNCRFEERRSGEKVVAMTELLHDISIELVNTLTRPARCEVRERIPQPDTGAEVLVEEVEVSPRWVVYDQRDRGEPIHGGRRWNVTLPAGQRANLRARYVVKIYANNELVGGNRREV